MSQADHKRLTQLAFALHNGTIGDAAYVEYCQLVMQSKFDLIDSL